MRWDTIVPDWLALIEANSDVTAVLGTNYPSFYMAGERDFEVPSGQYSLISPGNEGEVYEVTLVQIDLYTRTLDQLKQLTRGVRKEAHHDLPITVGSEKIWSRLDGTRPIRESDDGIWDCALDFRLEYLRSKWA